MELVDANQSRLCQPRTTVFWLLVGPMLLVGATPWSQAARAQEPPDDQEGKFSQKHSWVFRGNPSKPAGLHLLGPNAEKCVRFEDEGLRITLPAGWKGDRPGTGVQADLRLQGDFAMWMSFEILKEPARADAGKISTRLSLGVSKVSDKNDRATNSRSVTGARGSVFVTWATLWNPEIGKSQMPSNIFPTKAKTGRLRLVRSGAQLFYHAAEEDGDWQSLISYPFGEEDVINVRITASTGGEKAELDVRVTELHVRSAALKNAPNAAETAPTPADQGSGTTSGNAPVRLMIVGGIAALVLIATAIGWLTMRRRGRAGKADAGKTDASAPAPRMVSFACAGCGKHLKARSELAGTNVKCPQCTQAVLVPTS
jgi:DNA-directed RNA polymerase subunit RPC12/RpoP